jgi:hypothetical protein
MRRLLQLPTNETADSRDRFAAPRLARRSIVTLLLLSSAIAGCGGDPGTTPDVASAAAIHPTSASASRSDEAVRRDLATLRAATAPFQRFELAFKAGWNVQAPPGCFASPAGGMGFHWNNAANVGTLDPAKPQFVMYEPQQDGSKKLVGAEFIFPGAPTDTPPVLFGRPFTWNSTFQVWALHVWIWKENPQGMFADWNPRVSCAFAGSAVMTKHH